MLRTRLALGASAFVVTTLAVVAFQPPAQDMEMPKPTAEHKKLIDGVGTWEGTLTYFEPGKPPSEAAAKESIEPIGGFWTQSRFECDFMGMPYLGTGCVGYDAAKKKYVGTWIDNMSSHLNVMEGDMKGDTLVMRWKAPDMTGQIVPHRHETRFTPDSYTSTFYMGEGEGTKTMVIDMKRTSKRPMEAGAKTKQ